MLRVTTERHAGQTMIELEGKLSGQWVAELEKAWREQLKTVDAPSITILLHSILYVNPQGKDLLREMARRGTHLEATGCMTRALVESIVKSASEGKNNPSAEDLPRKILGILFLATLVLWAPLAFAQGEAMQEPRLHDVARPTRQRNPQLQIAALSSAQLRMEKNTR